jgi:repressor LexA
LTGPHFIVKIHDIMGRKPATKLTTAHSRILQAIARYVEQERHASLAELVADLGFAGSTSLAPTLRVMERNGYIEIHGGGKRGRRCGISLTQRGKVSAGIAGLRVLGQIAAGPLTEALEQTDVIAELNDLLPYKPGDFFLEVQGDSMIGDGILSGDKVLLRPHVQIKNGEIAAVHIGADYLATLKRVYFGPGRNKVTLKASNPNYRDITTSAKDVKIAGVFRGLVRPG